MSIQMQPYIVGAISEAIDGRLGLIAKKAAVAFPDDPARQAALHASLVQDDLGKLAADRTRIEKALDLVKSSFFDWWKQGQRTVQQGDFDTFEDGTYFLRLNHFPRVAVGRDEVFNLQGAFISCGERDGERDWTLTVLFSSDLDPDPRTMPLEILAKHQARVVNSTWKVGEPAPETTFYGRREIADHPATVAAISDIWSDLGNILALGQSALGQDTNPVPSSPRL